MSTSAISARGHSHYITGRNARNLQIITARSAAGLTCTPRAGGTKAQMEHVLREAVRNWTLLPAGREIEDTFAKLYPPKLKLVPDETVDRTAPAPAARRRTAGETEIVIQPKA